MDLAIANMYYVNKAMELADEGIEYYSDEDKEAVHKLILMSVGSYSRFYGSDCDKFVERLLNLLSNVQVDMSTVQDEQMKKIAEVLWKERDIYRDTEDIVEEFNKIIGGM